jgi:hypothetical protein
MLAVAEACEVHSKSMVFGMEVNVWTINACITADILFITRQGDWKFKVSLGQVPFGSDRGRWWPQWLDHW